METYGNFGRFLTEQGPETSAAHPDAPPDHQPTVARAASQLAQDADAARAELARAGVDVSGTLAGAATEAVALVTAERRRLADLVDALDAAGAPPGVDLVARVRALAGYAETLEKGLRNEEPLRVCVRELLAYAVAGGPMPDDVREPLQALIRTPGAVV